MLDRNGLPYEGQLWKSLLFGFTDREVPEKISWTTALIQILIDLKFTILQIALIVILHIALYFQYDMIVREDVFNKMVYHKIGPKFSADDIKAKLQARFPMMDDEMLDHLARAMRAHEVDGNNNNNNNHNHHNNMEAEVNDHQNENEVVAPHINDDSDANELEDPDFNPNDVQSSSDSDAPHINDEFDNRDPDEHEDPDFIPNDIQSSSDSEIEELNDEVQELVEPENNWDQLLNPVNRQDQLEFDAVIQQNLERRGNENNNNEPIAIQLPNDVPFEEARQAQGQPAPLMLNIRLRLFDVLFYSMIGILFSFSYLIISYIIPTIVGFLLLKCYFGILKAVGRGLAYLFHFSNLEKVYYLLLQRISFTASVSQWIQENVITGLFYYYNAYINNSMKSSMYMRGLPALTTYLTAVTLICCSPEWLGRNYSRQHSMPGKVKRLAFQLLFAFKCTFKVFTLFFIELAGFPILAGLMLDFSLIAPCLKSHQAWLWVPSVCTSWKPAMFLGYWTIGTLYMYWFAKYIGMVRQDVIRPGVLFFIRSPDDPNIRILHDSLIHPMNIQLSRLCLSMFIYAVFIIVGFGFHTRFFFPVVLKSKFLETTTIMNEESLLSRLLLINLFYVTKRTLESNETLKLIVKQYWQYIFTVCARRLRLSSFILGKDIATERGHIIYRNMFYEFFAPSRAKWSNPELFSTPKTLGQAKQLFNEDPSVHAYFIPDGVLLRVPSSDIVSRNYVQTMFVPVTKDDQLLKPLDLERIKERNLRNAGEFGYLDQQNTEFDEYFICYVPPHFRARYLFLISLMWLFASILIIGSAFISNLTMHLVGGILMSFFYLIWGKMFGKDVSYPNLNNFFYPTQLSFVPVFTGSMVLAYLFDQYRKLQAIRDAHTVHDRGQEPIQAGEHERANQHEEQAGPVGNANINEVNIGGGDNNVHGIFHGIMNTLFNNTYFKFTIMLLFLAVENFMGIVRYFSIFAFSILITWNYLACLIPSDFLRPVHPFKMSSLQVALVQAPLLISVIRRSMEIFSIYVNNRQDSPLLLTKRFIRNININYKEKDISMAKELTIFFFICSAGEYMQHPDKYVDFTRAVVFMMYGTDFHKSHTAELSWSILQHLYYVIVAAATLFALTMRLKRFLRSWSKVLTQSVKDEVYAKGRSLENLQEN